MFDEYVETFRELTSEFAVPEGLVIAYIIVGILIAIMGIAAMVLRLLVFFRYTKANHTPIKRSMSGIEAARYALDNSGLQHIKVKKAGFIREGLFGNYYNVLTKTIYLRSWLGKIDKRESVTAVALGVQKAALARLCEEGDAKTKLRGNLSLIGIFGPMLIVPILIGGSFIDYIFFKSTSIVSTVCLALDGILLGVGFVVTFLNIPVEKQANELALQMLQEYEMADEQELETIRGVYKAYILQYIADFILEVLRLIQWLLEAFIRSKRKDS
ncbi:MAG: zinc metallopeptidase [Clostridia bacterium]|nr:zinc metallopeptidase [Clostridia bacterium]